MLFCKLVVIWLLRVPPTHLWAPSSFNAENPSSVKNKNIPTDKNHLDTDQASGELNSLPKPYILKSNLKGTEKPSDESQNKDVSKNTQKQPIIEDPFQSRSGKPSSFEAVSGSGTQKPVNIDALATAAAVDLGRFLFPKACVPVAVASILADAIPPSSTISGPKKLLQILVKTRKSLIWWSPPVCRVMCLLPPIYEVWFRERLWMSHRLHEPNLLLKALIYRNLPQVLLCALEGNYLEAQCESVEHVDGLEGHVQCLKFSCYVPVVTGRGFIEVEDNGLTGSFSPFIAAEYNISTEIRMLEKEIELMEIDILQRGKPTLQSHYRTPIDSFDS
ncbi:Cysteine desulfurase mitochondrial [Orobanche minor]